ncbi:type II toxin-antitoxin system RelE/ParE family toxin [Natronosporangium hydrolyticum]|uniref:Type II toxin-antitoxin system RelE/ParE family toxin n=1 Tax=Natronosporangium hydrolyticum TaxID=2811111 RepID=A0A895YEQ3_9ACTN|nr:type II toxin-antitoxin system RelE/ParE family toxin [Natronosporangium hydrolyticum]QSB16287.1 type II toxin-antitoxin system RelE/ParE family toxin [Natronosporangium hydrolyticum]
MSDLYDVRLSPGAARALEVGPPRGLPVAAAFAVYEFLDGPLRQDPWRVSKPLGDELEGFRGARRGEYRVILSVDEELRVIDVVRIDHRANVYR